MSEKMETNVTISYIFSVTARFLFTVSQKVWVFSYVYSLICLPNHQCHPTWTFLAIFISFWQQMHLCVFMRAQGIIRSTGKVCVCVCACVWEQANIYSSLIQQTHLQFDETSMVTHCLPFRLAWTINNCKVQPSAPKVISQLHLHIYAYPQKHILTLCHMHMDAWIHLSLPATICSFTLRNLIRWPHMFSNKLILSCWEFITSFASAIVLSIWLLFLKKSSNLLNSSTNYIQKTAQC